MASPSINTLRRMSICKSPAWKDTQRILKRSGLVYRGERSESFDPEKHFNRYTVRYLYLLNMIALELSGHRPSFCMLCPFYPAAALPVIY